MIRIYPILILLLSNVVAQAQFSYISPMPGSGNHQPKTSIVIRNGSFIDPESLSSQLVTLTGSTSGSHECNIVLSDDQKSIVIYPVQPFFHSETVTVQIEDGFKKTDGSILTGTSFQFGIRSLRTPEQQLLIQQGLDHINDDGFNTTESEYERGGGCEGLPALNVATNTPDAYNAAVWYSNFKLIGGSDGNWYRTLVSNEGDSINAVCDDNIGLDWKINLNGYLTCYNTYDSCFSVYDSSFNEIDSYCPGNGWTRADEHEFLLYPNSHGWLMIYDDSTIDLTSYGGDSNATVFGLIVQELDANQNVIFQWRSWDHFDIDDADSDVPFTTQTVDPVHGNSIDLDTDGNVLISSRHMCEVTKIDYNTGNIIWRMGGENNQFTFVNDIAAIPFSYQHDFRRLPDGTYSLFNNNNNAQPEVSSVKVYELDQVNHVATLLWSYEHPEVSGYNVFARAMGNAQLLPNGNFFICWGFVNMLNAPFPNFTEVDPAGNIVWEMRMTGSQGYYSYRGFKFKWCPIPGALTASTITDNSATLGWSGVAADYLVDYKLNSSSIWTTVPVSGNSTILNGLQPNSLYDWRVRSLCSSTDSSSYSTESQFNTLDSGIIGDPDQSFSLNIFPNPSSNIIHLYFELQNASEPEITLFNTLGQIEIQARTNGVPGANWLEFPLPALPAGLYILQFRVGEETALEKFVVQ